MKIHQYYYQLGAGVARAVPVSPQEYEDYNKASYVTGKDFQCNSQDELSDKIKAMVSSLKKDVPITTKAHLLVAHVDNADGVPMDTQHWFAIAEAVVRQRKERRFSGNKSEFWPQWLDAAWSSVVVPDNFKGVFDECTSGSDALALLSEPETPMLATICLIATSSAPVTARGLPMKRKPLRIHTSWSARSKSLSFRAVYPEKRATQMNKSIKELVFQSQTAAVFKLAGRWAERCDSSVVDRPAMQVRELLALSYLTDPKTTDIQAVFDFLRTECDFTLEEVIANEMLNIDKKNSVISRRLFEVLLGGEWKNIESQIELLRATDYPPEAIAAALVEGFTKHVISIDENTGKLDLPQLPDVLM